MYDQRPWLQNYPNGVPANIDPNTYTSLVEFLDECLARYKSKPAFACMGTSISFREIDRQSKQFGAYLLSRGLKPGDKIALMMPNMLQYPIAIFGALRAGLVLVNTNPLYTTHEMLHQFRDSGAKAIVIAENFASKLEEIISETEIEIVIQTSIGELLGFIKGAFIDFIVRTVKRKVPKFNLPNAIRFSEAVKQGKAYTIPEITRHHDDTILIQYTGGTTGVSKGAMLTNKNMVANMLQIRAVLGVNLEEGKEIALSPLPMYHSFAFAVNCLALMSIGSQTVLVVNARDIKSVIAEFRRYPISIMTGVNTLYNAILNHKLFPKQDYSSLKVTVAGGMALHRSIAEKWQKETGCPLVEGYGLTETAPVASVNPIDGSGRLGSIGLPVPSTEMMVVDSAGKPVAPGEVGEICIKGPQVMKGYYKRADETSHVMMNDWFKTGDMGRMQEGGYFEIVDRIKDMINVSGFNVYPNEIEEVVCQLEGVEEAAAVGVPDDKCGEAVKLFVVKKEKSLTKDDILDHCRKFLTNYKIPKQMEFRDDLPKTNVGKILRRALRE